MLKALAIAILILALSVCGYYALERYVEGIELNVSGLQQVNAGKSALHLCRQWQEEQKLTNNQCLALRVYLKRYPQLAKVKQGVYLIDNQKTLLEVLSHYRSGKEAQFAITFIEGETLGQSLRRLSQAPYLIQDINMPSDVLALLPWPSEWGDTPTHAEGLLYPDTYYYTANSSASAVVKRSQAMLISEIAKAWNERQTEPMIKTPYHLLVLASVIEKESSYAPEKSMVASVFVNRLRKNMRLQTDPTVIYGLENFNGNITRADLNNPHPYNTYRHHGLPPTPISIVSKASLAASANPAQTSFYYFVSKGDGTHQFSSTLKEHNAAVKKYILGDR